MSIIGFKVNGSTEQYNYPNLDNRPVPDETLSQEGQPADAKATGNAIGAITPQFTDSNNDGNIVITLG